LKNYQKIPLDNVNDWLSYLEYHFLNIN
jgi:hypothetical protein